MARIIRKERNLEKEFLSYQNKIIKKSVLAIFLFGIGMISGMFSFYNNQTILLFVAFGFGITSVGILISIVPLNAKINIIKSGIDGENLTNRCIALLPESYTAFRNLTIFHNDRSSEIDILIIGPTGVFVVETKNLNGSIHGNINDKYWTQHKIGRAGTPYSKVFYSPVKQVNTHVYRVANYLKEHGIRTYVNAIVYFSNINTSINLSGDDEKAPLFSAKNEGASQMLHHILNNNQRLSQKECAKIINLLQNV